MSFPNYFLRAVLLEAVHSVLRRNHWSVIEKIKKRMIAMPWTRTRNCHGSPPSTRTEPVARPGNRYINIRHCDYTRQCYRHQPGTMLGDVYNYPRHEAAFGTLEKLKHVAKKTGVAKPGEVKPWLEQQDAYTLHHPVQTRYPRNPYSVDNIMDKSPALFHAIFSLTSPSCTF